MTPNNPDDPLEYDTDMSEGGFDEDFTDAELVEDGEYGDSENYDEENWDEESLDTPPAAKPKKKFSLFNILLVGGAVLIGGGILVYQFAGKSAPPPAAVEKTAETAGTTPEPKKDDGLMAMQQEGEQQQVDSPAPQDTPQDPAAKPQKGFMDDPSQLGSMAKGPATPETDPAKTPAPGLPEAPSMTGVGDTVAPAETAPAPETSVTLNQDTPETKPEADKPATTAELPVPQNLPPINAIKKAAPVETAKEEPKPAEEKPVVVADTPAPVDSLPTPTPAPAKKEAAPAVAETAVQSPREAELQSKLDEAVSRISALETQLKEEKAAPAPKADTAQIDEMKATIARLEDKISDLSSRPAPTSSAPVATADMNDEPVMKPVRKTVRKKKPHTDADAPYSPAVSAVSKWELRGARPGEAMIGKSGQAGLQTVRVGDTLAGIGQVRSIAQVGGRWVVQGSTGSITQ